MARLRKQLGLNKYILDVFWTGIRNNKKNPDEKKIPEFTYEEFRCYNIYRPIHYLTQTTYTLADALFENLASINVSIINCYGLVKPIVHWQRLKIDSYQILRERFAEWYVSYIFHGIQWLEEIEYT